MPGGCHLLAPALHRKGCNSGHNSLGIAVPGTQDGAQLKDVLNVDHTVTTVHGLKEDCGKTCR